MTMDLPFKDRAAVAVRKTVWMVAFTFLLAALLLATGAEPEITCRALGPGVEYIHEKHSQGPYSIHIVKVDPSRTDVDVIVRLAKGTILGRETVTDMALSVPPSLGKPLAVVNGDYFEMGRSGSPRYEGNLQGLHISRGELIHSPSVDALWFDANRRPHLAHAIQSQFSLSWPDGTQSAFGLNCSTTADKSEVSSAPIVLYTPSFGPSTKTRSGMELTLSPAEGSPWLPLQVNACCTGVVEAVSSNGDAPIRAGRMVVSVVTNMVSKLPPIRVGDRVAISTAMAPVFTNVTEAIAGGPVLLLDGRSPHASVDRKSLAPRTVIGFNSTNLFLVVVDGRQPNLSIGMSHGELADLMIRLGCTDAINMDGGGSSCLWLDGKVVSSPSDGPGRERPVGNAVIILRKPSEVK
jgi:exopolysaccharide biosynthesis protein